jgi:hypothetical protein
VPQIRVEEFYNWVTSPDLGCWNHPMYISVLDILRVQLLGLRSRNVP